MVRVFGVRYITSYYYTGFTYILDSEIIFSKSQLRKIKSRDIRMIDIKLNNYEHLTQGKTFNNGIVIIRTKKLFEN
jgi:hypothetical protein